MENQIKLGDEVEDIVTGFKGVVTSKTEWIHGCLRFGVQPRTTEDGKLPQDEGFDGPCLKITKEGAFERTETILEIALGDEVKDTISGFKGVAIGRTDFLFAQTRFIVQPKVDKDGRLTDAKGFDHASLELVNPKKAAVKPAKTGGPANDRLALTRP